MVLNYKVNSLAGSPIHEWTYTSSPFCFLSPPFLYHLKGMGFTPGCPLRWVVGIACVRKDALGLCPFLAARFVPELLDSSLQCLYIDPTLPIPVFLAVWLWRAGSASSSWNVDIASCDALASHDHSLLPLGILVSVGERRACAGTCAVATSRSRSIGDVRRRPSKGLMRPAFPAHHQLEGRDDHRFCLLFSTR